MISKLKKMLKKILGKKFNFYYLKLKKAYKFIYKNKCNTIIGILKSIKNTRVYEDNSISQSFVKLFNDININCSESNHFYYNIDFCKTIFSKKKIFNNISIDYSIFLNNSLEDFKNMIKTKKNEFYQEELKTINAISLYLDKILDNIYGLNADKIKGNIQNIKNKKSSSFDDALQRILFFNMLFWQMNHHLIGLGRLDMILNNYYEMDIKKGVLTKEKAKELLKEFLLILHRDYKFKSSMLLGDTGQIIELGGLDSKGNYLCNELTYIFIELMEELKLPDPKVLVRVSKNMPRKLMEKSLKCIQTGIGCPLFANDDVIIEKLIKFGYEKEDAYNYGTSACWEPYIIGKSSAQNNIESLNFMTPLNDLLAKEDLNIINNFESFLEVYKSYLKKYIDKLVDGLSNISFEKDPLLSLFIDDCLKVGKDISEGGAKYNDFGLTGVGLANVVNSLVNVKHLVYEQQKMILPEFNNIRKNNYDNYEGLIKKLKNCTPRYGDEDDYVINLSNNIINYTSKLLEGKKNCLGGRYKFGVSSPNYITDSKNALASFDGRKNGEPFNVHISTDSSNAYTELINFAAKLDYNENRFNGNVVDFFVTPNFIKDNFDKFVDFLMSSIKVGFFEMQMNVVSSAQLIEARKNPEKFPNLVVRVWGFSAYFKDLPDEYKDYLIERALKNEGNS